MRLTKSRHAAALADLALSELEAIVSAPSSGGQRSERDKEMLDLRLNEALAMVSRVGSIIDHEAKGNKRMSFGLWWKKAGKNPLYRLVNKTRSLELKEGERGGPGTTIVFLENEDEPAGTTDDPRVMLPPDPSVVIELLRLYLEWCGTVLIPQAEEQHTL